MEYSALPDEVIRNIILSLDLTPRELMNIQQNTRIKLNEYYSLSEREFLNSLQRKQDLLDQEMNTLLLDQHPTSDSRYNLQFTKSLYDLIEKGASPDVVVLSKNGEILPLINKVILERNTRFLKLLLKKGVDVNIKEFGAVNNRDEKWSIMTPLMCACSVNDTYYVEMLLKAGAKINEITEKGETAFHIATKLHNYVITDLLLKEGFLFSSSMINPFITLMFSNPNTPVQELFFIRKLLKLMIDPNVQDEKERSILHYYVRLFNHTQSIRYQNVFFDIISLLLEYGADPNIQDVKGKTPLFWAKTPEITELLINFGADVNITNNKNKTPLFKLLSKQVPISEEMIRIYLLGKVEKSFKNGKKGITIHQQAIIKKQPKRIIQLLK